MVMNLSEDNPAGQPPSNLLGRSREFDAAVSAVWAGRSVLLVGPWGSGLSRFAWTVVERLGAEGAEVFALFARNAPALRPDAPVRVFRTFSDLQQAMEATKHLRPPVVVLDAPIALDDEVTMWVAEAVKAGHMTAITLVRSEGGPLRRDTRAISELVGLWLEGYSIRVDIGPIPRPAGKDLVSNAAAGTVLDGETRATILRDGSGLPVLLKELTRIAVDSGDIPPRASPLFPPSPANGSRALDLVEPRMRELGPELLDALLTLAALDGITESRLRRRMPSEHTEELLTRHLAEVDPMNKRVTVSRIEAERALALGASFDEARLIDGITADLESGFTLDAAETLFLAHHVLISPDLRDRVQPEALGASFVTAAHESLARGRIERAFDFAAAAVAAGAEKGPLVLDLARAALRGKDGDAALSPVLSALVDEMQWQAVRDRAEQVLSSATDPFERMSAFGPLTLALAALGDAEGLRETLVQTAALGPHLMRVASPDEVAATNERIVHFTVHGTVALLVSGTGWDKLDDALDYMTEWTLSNGFVAHLPLLAGARGMLAFGRGDFPLAAAEFERATSSDFPSASPLTRPWLLFLWARSAAALGDLVLAEALIGRAVAERAELTAWERYGLVQARSDLLAASGEREAAAALLVEESTRQAQSSPVFTVVMIYEAIRNGARDDGLLEQLASSSEAVSHEAIHAMGDIARDWVARDARALSRDRWAVQQRGLTLLAHQIAESGSDTRGTGRGGADAREALSEREREVAKLAGAGMSNGEIASKLYLSVRTVESHLYSARLKTGASTRRDLGRLAGTDSDVVR